MPGPGCGGDPSRRRRRRCTPVAQPQSYRKVMGPPASSACRFAKTANVTAVMTLERPPERPFNRLEEIETVRLICDLCAPGCWTSRRSDRWIGARMASRAREHVGVLLGPEHTWAKVGAVLVFLMAVFLATAKGDYRIKAAFAFEAQNQQVVVAPFDTFTKSVSVEPGDRVEGGKIDFGDARNLRTPSEIGRSQGRTTGVSKADGGIDARSADRRSPDRPAHKATRWPLRSV